jgi:hypothetical protein
MYALSIDREHRVLLAEVSGELTDAVLTDLEKAIRAVLAETGPLSRIMDFSGVVGLGVAPQDLVLRARTQHMTRQAGARVYVAATDTGVAMCALFASHQEAVGAPKAAVVRSRSEAYRQLGLSEPRFLPV